ncbi:uncharacterized protein H6S33_012224 [Morchella sextelata]|uniref:uncharacterized protein n=1 Tax=Morchella sextelata TaxID=1174677 RepID=UPI001D03ED33|nr:uncharacterized protein H6S33_012224 [Morchella sextelata]KAH0610697.1 hypothetical protein H6S33_012224 [Morchella sextelata]
MFQRTTSLRRHWSEYVVVCRVDSDWNGILVLSEERLLEFGCCTASRGGFSFFSRGISRVGSILLYLL